MAEEPANLGSGTGNAELGAGEPELGIANPDPLRSTFGFDRTDEQWLAIVRDATAPPGLGTLGPYTLLAEIGRGSQGAVFKAIQPGTQRIIALKRLAAGAFASSSARARFEREVETASALSHPGIVTVLGTDTCDGQPILLMEWVDGQPIDQWALGPETAPPGTDIPHSPRPLQERLELFARVCDAVSHAHQRGVLHRDLKPSNILVDREGRPRILDFGLAKLIGEDPRRISRTSSACGIIGTPAYAAPEQLDGRTGASTDTRTDVYALGVILYQVLTGRLPFDDADLPGLIEAVRHSPPRRPSHVGGHLGAELDAVVLTALAKEPARRYQSADALAADLRRYLAGQVVLAHPPSAAYQLRKLISRHRVAFAIFVGAAVAVSALAITSSILAAQLAAKHRDLTVALGKARASQEQAQTEAARNQATVEFLQEMFDSMSRAIAAGEARPAQMMLKDARVKLESGHMSVQPELEVTLWRRLASAAFRLNLYPEAAELVAHEVQLCEQNLPADHVEYGYCRWHQGGLAENRGDLPKALGLYSEASRIFTARLGEESAENAWAINNVGCVLKDELKFDQSFEAHQHALAIRTRLFGVGHRDVAMSYRNLGTLRRAEKKWDASADYYKQALQAAAAATPPIDPVVAGISLNMCKLAYERGNIDEAVSLTLQTQAATEKIYGEESAPLIEVYRVWGNIRSAEKKWDLALEADRRALALTRRFTSPDHPLQARVTWTLGAHLVSAGRHAEAEPILREAADLYSKCDPPSPTWQRRSLRSLADCLSKLDRPAEANAIREQVRQLQPPTP